MELPWKRNNKLARISYVTSNFRFPVIYSRLCRLFSLVNFDKLSARLPKAQQLDINLETFEIVGFINPWQFQFC